MARALTLNDGTQYEVDWCNADKGIFHVNLITDSSFVDLVTMFSNPENVRIMHYQIADEEVREFEGYTALKSIMIDEWSTGSVLITLAEPDLPTAR